MNDRRRDPRFPVYWPVRAGHRSAGCSYGHVLNVSGTGFLFTAPDEFAEDELVEMEITINPLFVIRCAARIARREKLDDGWAFGATFHNLSVPDMSVLAQTLVAIQTSESDSALSYRPRPPLGTS